MVKLRSPYEEPMAVPWLDRVVNPGQVVEVRDDQLPGFLAAGWTTAPARKAAVKEKEGHDGDR